ncbi:GNAT family N-acetyltransferase [Mariniblastus sp.]|nr:GNAT family N-acetyltransferase [Mariniblastus sp.]
MKAYRIEQLVKQDRSRFDCGTGVLNNYLKKQARQEQRRKFCTCYLVIENASDTAVGFYTLSSSSIALASLPDRLRKKLPRYHDVPVARLGRLAVDQTCQGQGLGFALVYDAIKRICTSGVGTYAIVVDAKDAAAVAFYERVGFELFAEKQNMLYLPMATAITLLES